MKYGEGVVYNFVSIELLFKTVSGDVTAFHRNREVFWEMGERYPSDKLGQELDDE